jgi:AraC family transcriptional regulator, ethanolamine operon transcriptional activator
METTFHFERHAYSGFEPSRAFDVVYGGHFEHRLLSPRRSAMEHLRLVLGDIRLEAGRYDFPVVAQGVMPRDCVCFGMVAEGLEVTRYNTELASEDSVQIYAPGTELMYHAKGPSRWISFAVAQEVIERVAQQRFGRPFNRPSHGFASLGIHPRRRAFLRQLADDAFALASAMQPDGFGVTLASEISDAFVTAYVDALGSAALTDRTSRSATAERHYHLILACERLMLSQGAVDIDLADVARRSGYSRRSLELIFQRGVGMTPGRWFTNIRLNGALRELLAPAPNCSVTDVATRWGFRHLSRFAQQYRCAFGELPSQTLKSHEHATLH